MRNISIMIFVGIATVLAGCSGTSQLLNTTAQDRELYEQFVSECTFKDGSTEAPKWICGYPIDSYSVTEVGYSPSGGESEAKARALVKLAGRIKTEVKSEITVRSTADNQLQNNRYEEVSQQTIAERLHNTRVLLRSTDPSTRGLYVLVVADETLFKSGLNESVVSKN